MTQRVEGGSTYNQTFDAENRLISVTVNSQTTQFIYDGDGNLVKKINPDGSKTIYVGGIYEVDKSSGGSVTGTKTYYPAAGAMRIGSTLYYTLKDHLGSASVVTDASGITVGEDRFYAFGETRLSTGSMFTDKRFTGQREITGLGIYHFGARFYLPRPSIFLSGVQSKRQACACPFDSFHLGLTKTSYFISRTSTSSARTTTRRRYVPVFSSYMSHVIRVR
jgi:YD repeat-containing protein